MPTLGLSMIVKNGAAELPHCLKSVQSVVDQIVIADTGSTDDTVAIARQFGATIIAHEWTDDFAAARNAALLPMTTDWILVLDADEELSEEAAAEIHTLIEQAPARVAGYQILIRNYSHADNAGVIGSIPRVNQDNHPRALTARSYSEHSMCRLFRRHAAIRFTCCIHENVEHAIVQTGMHCERWGNRILHFGTLSEQDRYLEKQDRYYRMLLKAVAQTPGFSHLWLQLALTQLRFRNDPHGALESARKVVALNRQEYGGWAFIAEILLRQNRHEECLEAIDQLPDQGDWRITKALAAGDVLFLLGKHNESHRNYVRLSQWMQENENQYPVTLRGPIESRLGYAEIYNGMSEAGIRRLRFACEMAPKCQENYDRLMKAYVLLRNEREAAETIEKALDIFTDETLFRRAAALWIRIDEGSRAKTVIDRGLEHFPQSIGLSLMAAELT